MQLLMRIKSAHPAWISYLLHRFSGILLILFTLLHFLLIGNVLRDARAVDLAQNTTTDWSSGLWVVLSEGALIAVLTVHVIGGLRILCIEWFAKNEQQQRWLYAMLLAPVFFVFYVCFYYLHRA